MALIAKVIYKSLDNLMVLNNFSLYHMGFRAIFHEKPKKEHLLRHPALSFLRAFDAEKEKFVSLFLNCPIIDTGTEVKLTLRIQ